MYTYLLLILFYVSCDILHCLEHFLRQYTSEMPYSFFFLHFPTGRGHLLDRDRACQRESEELPPGGGGMARAQSLRLHYSLLSRLWHTCTQTCCDLKATKSGTQNHGQSCGIQRLKHHTTCCPTIAFQFYIVFNRITFF